LQFWRFDLQFRGFSGFLPFSPTNQQTTSTMIYQTLAIAILLLAHVGSFVSAGPVLVAACYSACNAGAVTCYTGAGLVFGTVTLATGPPSFWAMLTGGAGVAAAATACGAIQGSCMAACTTMIAAPTL
jgi:hypothetical protein